MIPVMTGSHHQCGLRSQPEQRLMAPAVHRLLSTGQPSWRASFPPASCLLRSHALSELVLSRSPPGAQQLQGNSTMSTTPSRHWPRCTHVYREWHSLSHAHRIERSGTARTQRCSTPRLVTLHVHLHQYSCSLAPRCCTCKLTFLQRRLSCSGQRSANCRCTLALAQHFSWTSSPSATTHTARNHH